MTISATTSTKVLFWDCETSPNMALVWGLWDQNVSLQQLLESGEMLCFSAFWGHAPEKPLFYSDWGNTHEGMVAALWDLLDKADVVVTYNGKRFDTQWAQREFLELRLGPPSPYRQVDLCQVIQKEFRFPSSKLAYVAERLLGEGKLDTGGFQLWRGVMNGDPKAQRKMRKYCIRDTQLLIPLHERLLPWIASYPSLAVITGSANACPKCGSTDLQRRGMAYTQTRAYQQWRCSNCGSWSRDARCEPGTSAGVTQVRNN